ncbi:unnamed protein product, partial [Rotaria sordida]
MTTLQLDDAKIDGSSITNGLSSNDSNATSSNEKEIDDVTTQEGIFIEVLNKLQNLKERAATSTRLKKSTLVDFQHILVELINVIEENKIQNLIKAGCPGTILNLCSMIYGIIKQLENDTVDDDSNELTSLTRTISALLSKTPIIMATPTIQTEDINSDDESSILSWHDNDSSDIEEEAETVNISDERIFSNILTKLQYLQSNISRINEAKSSANKENESCNNSQIKTSKSSKTELSEDDNEEQRLDKTVLVEWYHILVELVNVIEDSKSDITKQNYFAVRKQTKSLSVTINTSKTWLQDDDTTYAHEIVDLYFNFFKLQHIKNYLTSNTDISDAVKLLYENCILSNVSRILEGAFNSVVYASSFTVEDLKQLIVYNEILIRHEDGIKVLNAVDLMSVLKEIRTTVKKSDSYFRETVEILCMTLALLSTPEQIKNDRKQMNIVLDGILNNVVLAAGEQDYRYQHMFHVSEPLVVLVKLFSYDRTLDYIMQHAEVEQLETTTTLEFLLDFFFKYYATVKHGDPLKLTTMTALCNIFWSVSLRPQYKQELCEDEEKFEEFK